MSLNPQLKSNLSQPHLFTPITDNP